MAAFKLAKTQHKTLNGLLAAYAEAAEALFHELADIESEWREIYESRTEKWQESDAGAEAAERLSALEEMISQAPEIDGGFDFDQFLSLTEGE